MLAKRLTWQLMTAIGLVAISTPALADVLPNAVGSGTDWNASAKKVDEDTIILVISNDSDSSLELYNNQFRLPMLTFVLLDAYGEPIERPNWFGDLAPSKVVINAKSSQEFTFELEEWYDDIKDQAKAGCLDLFWRLTLRPINSADSQVFGGMVHLSCPR